MKRLNLTPRAALLAAVLLAPLAAQSQRPAPADEIVELSPFVISTAAVDGNRITEATAGTLVARPIDKLPMGLQVVSAEMMKELDIFNADGLNRLV
ncbi:MAG: Ferrichrome-iron receptor precursor, partial [Verrucomicrobiota bacterium]